MTVVDDDAPDNSVVYSSGNVFDDLNLPSSPEEMVKIEMSRVIAAILRRRKLTQVEAAEIVGTDQPKISALLRGRLDGFSTDRLLGYVLALGVDVDIRLSGNSGGQRGQLKVSEAA